MAKTNTTLTTKRTFCFSFEDLKKWAGGIDEHSLVHLCSTATEEVCSVSKKRKEGAWYDVLCKSLLDFIEKRITFEESKKTFTETLSRIVLSWDPRISSFDELINTFAM